MKTKIIVLFTILLGSLAHADRIGNGGDAVAQEFTFLATELITYMPYLPPSNVFSSAQKKAYTTATQETQVITQDHLMLRGAEVDAINYPDKKIIEVNRSRWTSLSSDPAARSQRQAVALHEYLWMAGIDDTNYAYSTPLYNDLMAAKTRWLSSPIAKNLAQAVCSGTAARDLVTVQQALTMGADPETQCEDFHFTCPLPPHASGTVFINGTKPLKFLIESLGDGGYCDTSRPTSADEDLVGLDILKVLLSFHPNLAAAAYTAALNNAFVAFDLIVAAGATEEDVLYGLMNSYPRSPITSFEKALDKGFDFNKFSYSNAVGKVLSTAVIVSGNRQDVIELLASRFAIDFCAKSAPPNPFFSEGKVISFVKKQYLPIVQKYGGACVP